MSDDAIHEAPTGAPFTRTAAETVPEVSVALVDGLSADDLGIACCRAWRLGDVGHRATAFYLEQLQATGLHQRLGFSSAAHFARSRLGVAARTAREFVALGRALRELEQIDAAFADGRLCWTKVRLLARVATPETERAWIERSLEVTAEQLEREVKGSEKGRPPRGDRKGLPEVRYTVRIQVDAVTLELWEQARRLLASESSGEMSEDDALRACATQVLQGGTDAPRNAGDSLFRVVVDRCPSCRSASVRTDAGPEPIAEAQAEAIACDAPALMVEDVAMPARGTGDDAKDQSAVEGRLEAPPDESVSVAPLPFGLDKPTEKAMRHRVLARDGFRCRCCESRRDLTAHHILFRSDGGPTVMPNLVSLCTRCHSLVHAGLMRVSGRAPHRVRIEGADGRPLAEVRALLGPGIRHVRAAMPTALRRDGEKDSEGGSTVGAPSDAGSTRSGTNVPMAPSISDEADQERSSLLRASDEGCRTRSGTDVPRSLRVTFAGLPAAVDAGWWREHAHLLTWHERRGVLEFTDGVPRPTPPSSDDNGAEPSTTQARRPQRLDAIVGQQRVVESLALATQAARARREPVDHVLLQGPPGLGKTTLARAVACEMGGRLHATSAPLVTDVAQLVGLLAGASDGDVVFLDELHALPRRVCEVLYEAMEDGTLGLAVSQGPETRTLRMALPRVTMIGATTDPDRLPRPLLDRFGLVEELVPYTVRELATITLDAALQQKVALQEEGALMIAKAAQGTPRLALRLVARLRDLLAARPCHRRGSEAVHEVLEVLGLDANGLGPRHRETLDLVRRHGRVGRSRLAGLLRISRGAVRDLIEPPLLALGLVRATPRGLAIA